MQRLLLVVSALLTVNAAPAVYDAAKPMHAHGSVIIKTRQYETMVSVRTGNDDGRTAHVFRMWAKPALVVDGSYDGAEVEYSGSSLIVTVPSSKTVLRFTVAGYQPAAGSPTADYRVIGLSHVVGPREAHGGAGWAAPDPWAAGAGGGSSCYSGGLGSSSCSQSNGYGSCSVVCALSNTYACCTNGNPPSCFCKVY